MSLPALAIKCECPECERHRKQNVAWQHGYFASGASSSFGADGPAWLYAQGLDSSNADEDLCAGGCETHGSCSDAGMTCGHCDECDSLCSCDKCSNCDSLADDCECCVSCGSSYCSYCSDCDNPSCECSCESDCDDESGGGNNGFGTIQVAPWMDRGYVKVPRVDSYADRWHEVWNVDRSIDLSQSAADFYLLEALAGGVVNHGAPSDAYLSMLKSEAKSQMTNLVAKLDRTFTGYVDAIIGGELRHHRASGSLRSYDRKGAWLEWKAIRAQSGLSALTDAVDLFLDFNSGGYGGEPWAQITRTLHARLSGKISPQLFVDRVFNLQHNGGSLFDKGSWSVANGLGWGYYELNTWVLPAHGVCPEPAWTILLAVASAEVRELFEATWRAGNGARRALGIGGYRPTPAMRLPMTSRYDGYYDVTRYEIDGYALSAMLQSAAVAA